MYGPYTACAPEWASSDGAGSGGILHLSAAMGKTMRVGATRFWQCTSLTYSNSYANTTNNDKNYRANDSCKQRATTTDYQQSIMISDHRLPATDYNDCNNDNQDNDHADNNDNGVRYECELGGRAVISVCICVYY